ncbi:hypothetical protein C8R44DRAFT_745498 [Mycena epipterygia]|nr:hypothetical protein C8R44DRAFT_745498 [Mycena epipterygia]
MPEYNYLTKEQREFFLEHGWLRIPNAIDKKILDKWMSDFWVRLGWDEHDKSTWKLDYLKMPKHHEIPPSDFSPDAWKAMCEIVGGEDKIDKEREYLTGDNFIPNFGSKYWKTHLHPVEEAKGWHTDNDYYRQFLDSATNALTIINCFTDVKPGQGGTFLAEDGIKGIVDFLYEHPEGLDPPFSYLYRHVKNCKKFATVEAKAGDVFITHALLPHSPSKNHLHEVRVITNPHVNLKDPYNLNRPDGDYTLCEQVILRALGRDSVPEFKPTRPREVYFPRTFTFKRARVQEELDRLVATAKAKGLPADSVDSIYLRGEEFIKEHEKRNGYDRPHGPGGLCLTPEDPVGLEFERERMKMLGPPLNLPQSVTST